MKLTVTGTTDTGMVREHNEDSYAIFADDGNEPKTEYLLNEQGVLLAVADGMGGANAGEVASALAISSIRNCIHQYPPGWKRSPGMIQNALEKCIESAHRAIVHYSRKHSETSGMGTTIVLTYFFEDNLYLVWAGDSRCYLYRQGRLELLSHDHSEMQELMDEGKITYAETFVHPDRHLITKYLGADYREAVHPEISVLPYLPGDKILLCSDGLNTMLVDQQISDIISSHQDLDACTKALIDLTNAMGGKDNATVILGEVLPGNL